MLPFGRRPRLKAVTVLGVLGVYAYIQTYFVMSPQDRSGMLSWYVIALASVGWCVLVAIGSGVCALIDRMRGPRPHTPGFEVVTRSQQRDS